MRIVVLALLAVVLSAASPPAGVDGDPVALLTAIYKTYTDIGPGEDGVPELSGVYSKRLQALIDKDEKETPEGDVGRIDWDLFVDGQDWQLTELKIVPALKEATRAEVRATFNNFGEPRDILYTLVLENGHWRIDDIQETSPNPKKNSCRGQLLRLRSLLTSGTSSPRAVAKSIWWSCSCTRISRICSAMANSLRASHWRIRSW
jgi:uncharacterized protein DUF3828